MIIRANPALDRTTIDKIIARTVGVFDIYSDKLLGGVGNERTDHPLDEPINVAARMAGIERVCENALNRCHVDDFVPLARAVAHGALGTPGAEITVADRLSARACLEGVRQGAANGEKVFAEIGACRDAPAFDAGEAFELETSPETLRALRAMKPGNHIGNLLDLSMPSVGSPTTPLMVEKAQADTLVPPVSDQAIGKDFLRHFQQWGTKKPWPLTKSDWPLSRVWAAYVDHQVANKNWRPDEAISSHGTLKMIIAILGDRILADYHADDWTMFRATYRQLPAKYAQQQPYRRIYEIEGPFAVIEAAKGVEICRISDKTWDKTYSRISPLYAYAITQQGAVLVPNTTNPLAGLFIKLETDQRTPAQVRNDWRIYSAPELIRLFNAPKFLGCASASRWKKPGRLVVRDARYWVVLGAFLHGNRREELILLKVKHVKQCPVTGIWYFNWRAQELRPFLKDSGSVRDVPLHFKFLALGFIEARVLGRDPEDDLLPDAGSDAKVGGDGGPIGQWFLRFRCSCGVDDEDLDLHASRHTVIMGLRPKFNTYLIEAVVGHESRARRSSIESYTHPEQLKRLKEVVDNIEMPIDVERLMEAVRRSDSIDPSKAWPDLKAARTWRRIRS